MITFSGVHVQKKGGVEGTPTATDIAVHSGRICRFGGAVWYPLLTHLVFVGMLALRRGGNFDTVAWAFLHDAHEIATSDVPRPFKCDCMREEQHAIDKRLLDSFNLRPDRIDFGLIKQCDIDACHIEAIQLGVKGFAEVELEHSADYTGSTEIYADESDVALFHGILRRPFFYFDVIEGPSSGGVWHFIQLLNDIKNFNEGDFYFWERVRGWETWFLRDPEQDGDIVAPRKLDFRGTDETRKALFFLTKLMDKYDLPQVIVNRTERMQISVLFHTQQTYEAAVNDLKEQLHEVLSNPDEFERQPDGTYRPVDPLETEILE